VSFPGGAIPATYGAPTPNPIVRKKPRLKESKEIAAKRPLARNLDLLGFKKSGES
jgi:hypothetical protein